MSVRNSILMILLVAASISAAADTRLELGRWEIVNTGKHQPALSAVISGGQCVVAASSDIDIDIHSGVYVVEALMDDGTSLTTKIVSKY